MTLRKIGLAVLVLIVLLLSSAIIYLGVRPTARPIQDQTGEELPGSVALLKELEINGMKQWISVRGKDRTNPILLWLHGGPGSAQMPMAHHFDQELEKHYTVVHWDQRGAGKSNHSGFSEDTMRVQQYKDDTLKLINYLTEMLDQEKIYLLGHSWGTQLGIELVSEHPQLFHGYVAVSQVVDHARAVEIATDWLGEKMKDSGDHDRLAELDQVGNPVEYHSNYRELAQLVNSYGGSMDIEFIDLALIAFRAPEYSFVDYYKLLDGMNRGGGPLQEGGLMIQFDYIELIPELEVPVYFFIGRNDYNTPHKLVEEYYQIIEAPEKELVVFENSAHTPFFAESEKFNRELIKLVSE